MTAAGPRGALLLAAALATAGLGIALYLTVVHYGDQPIACNGIGDCEYVNSSEYAKLLGIPVALIGAAAYATMLAGSIAAWLRRDALLLLAAWGVALASFAFSIYLTYIELEVLEAICVYCVASASVMTALFAALSAAVWMARDDVFGDWSAEVGV
ncbi:MAG TPA: vitamin K epoxide reductase family protein [Dehalococcoidia bacterium]|nr:vitamin K epoxide reductase family protein [Dehalococcoidia bacterium]